MMAQYAECPIFYCIFDYRGHGYRPGHKHKTNLKGLPRTNTLAYLSRGEENQCL